jgi:Lysyl oxidase
MTRLGAVRTVPAMRLAGALGAALALLLAIWTSPALAAEGPVAVLDAGQSAFWPGAFVSDSRVDDPSACGIEGSCFDYRIEVKAAHAKVLRVALASFDDSNGWDVRLLDPAGHEAASGSTYTLNGVAENYDAELFAHDPAPGVWTMQVIAKNVHLGDFQARAAVDPVVDPEPSKAACVPRPAVTVRIPASVRRDRVKSIVVYVGGHRQRTVRGARRALAVSLRGLAAGVAHVRLEITTARGRVRLVRRVNTCPVSAAPSGVADEPPNVAADPPWHLTFQQPPPMVVVEGGNFTALGGVHNPTMQAGGHALYNCLPEESAEQGAQRCLRFTSGFASLGPGPFEVYGSSATFASPAGGPLYQVVYRSDGTKYSRPAGSFVFHPVHAHYHVLGIAEFRFYRVNPDHSLTEAGKVLKEGFCLGNIKMYDWHSFAQAEIDPKSVDNCEPSAQPDGSWRFYEGIAAGWEDSYKWQTSGQFVDVGNDPNGYYLLRLVVNPQRKILETTYADNTAYAYMQIDGNDVRVIERGHGEGPWDVNKVVEDPVITR